MVGFLAFALGGLLGFAAGAWLTFDRLARHRLLLPENSRIEQRAHDVIADLLAGHDESESDVA